MTIKHPVLTALLVTAIWGLNVVAIKIGVSEVSPALFNFLRFSLVTLILLPFWRVAWKDLPLLIGLSLLMGIGHFFLLSVGTDYVDSNTAVILIMLGAPISSLLVYLLGLEKMSTTQSLGIAIAFTGAVAPLLISGSIDLKIGAAFIFFAMVAWATTNIYIRRLKEVRMISFQFWIGLVSTPVCLISWYLGEETASMFDQVSVKVMLCVLYMVLFSSILAYSLWFATLSQHGVNKVVNITLLQPVFTAISAYIILQDLPELAQLIGAGITVGGIYLYYFQGRSRPA